MPTRSRSFPLLDFFLNSIRVLKCSFLVSFSIKANLLFHVFIWLLLPFQAWSFESIADLFKDESVENHSLSSRDSLVSSVIGNHVSAISGDFVDQSTDCTLIGPEPLALQRFYSSHPGCGLFGLDYPLTNLEQYVMTGSTHRGWQLNHFTKLHVQGKKSKQSSQPKLRALVPHASSSQMIHESKVKDKEYEKGTCSIKLRHNKGITNCASGAISARTNPKNVVTNFNQEHEVANVVFGSGDVRHYFGRMDLSSDVGSRSWIFHPFLENKANGNQIIYHGTKKIEAFNRSKSVLYGWYKFKWTDSQELQVMTSHYEKPIIYQFRHFDVEVESSKDARKRYYLTNVQRPDQPNETYHYVPDLKKETWLIKRKEKTQKHFIEVEYYKKGDRPGEYLKTSISDLRDPRSNRVRYLKAPVGVDETPLVTHEFFYDLNFKINEKAVKLFHGITSVYDAHRRKTCYHFNDNQRLEKCVRFAQGKPYHQTVYCWKDCVDSHAENAAIVPSAAIFEQTNLKGRLILDGGGSIVSARLFDYDSRGNIVEESLYGHLTGTTSTPLVFDHKKQTIQKGAEVYRKQFTYSKDDYHLLLEEREDNGRKILYRYLPDSDVVESKLLCQGDRICLREFYEYDENNSLVKMISDNGSALKKEDLSYITERHITYYFPRTTFPIGLPERVDEMYLDLDTMQEKLLKRTQSAYTNDGKLLRQDVFDANEVHRYSLSWEYDSFGHLIKETNALGHVISKKYDVCGNLIWEQGPRPDFETEYLYDYSNRCTQSKEIHAGQTFITNYRYDLVGNRIAKADRYGNETTYQYDDLNRLTQTTYPAVWCEKGWVQPTTKTSYDCVGNIIQETDERDFCTKKCYNTRGKLISSLLPDGQQEFLEYHLDGTLAKKITSNGTYTHFEVDCFGRITKETTYSPQGVLLAETSQTYYGMHKASSTDASGLTTTYHYDWAGRLSRTACQDKEEAYVYDSLGRMVKKKEAYEDNQFKITCMEYDLLDRLIEERIEDEQGNVLRKASYSYDLLGKQTHITEETNAGPCTRTTLYNSDKKVVQTTDPAGNQTHITYLYNYRNPIGQLVLKTIVTDPLGRRTITIDDALGKPASIQQFDPYGLLLSHQELAYDLKGNVTHICNHIIVDGQKQSHVDTTCAYQETNQLICLTQAKALPEQQITYFHYNTAGQKELTVKPDGSLLHERYDALGRLVSQEASDHSLHYTYTYNQRHQPVTVFDAINQTHSHFSYDARGRLLKEVLSNDLSLSYEYDGLDRAKSVVLPDGSRIAYRYDAANLREVERIKGGHTLYLHRYETFDLAGLPLKMTRPDQQVVNYLYDSSKRAIEQDSPLYKQKGVVFDQAGRLTQYAREDHAGPLHYTFAYDNLDHLIHETGPFSHTYSCDSLHNRLSKDAAACRSNGLHQLIQQGNNTYTYDLNGNLASESKEGTVKTYTYDQCNRLTSAQTEQGDVHYQYDAFHRRVAKVAHGKTTRYLYVGKDEIGSVDETGEIQELRLLGHGHGAEIGASIAIELKGKLYIPSHDFSGHIVQLNDLEGQCIETYRYSAFGESLIYDAQGQTIPQSTVGNPWQFSSKRVDSETGFIFFGRRYYNPDTGRWTTTDPAGFADGPNLYAYLHHHPLNAFDLYGLMEEREGQEEKNYPLADVNYHDKEPNTQPEDASPNEAPLGFEEKKAGKKSRMYYCGFNQVLEMGIGFMHGIMNNVKSAYDSAKMLSAMANDHFITINSNSSRGFILDLIRCIYELCFYGQTKAVINQQKIWDAYFDHAKPGSIYLHFSHSEGCIITRNAIMNYSEERRQRIDLILIAPGAYTENKYAHRVYHYRSTRDIVPLLDLVGAARCRDTTTVLDPHPDAPWFDHSFDSPTYRDIKEYHIQKYQEQYGTI